MPHARSIMSNRPSSYVVVGEGPLQRRLRDVFSELGLRDVVYLMGWSYEPARYVAVADVQSSLVVRGGLVPERSDRACPRGACGGRGRASPGVGRIGLLRRVPAGPRRILTRLRPPLPENGGLLT